MIPILWIGLPRYAGELPEDRASPMQSGTRDNFKNFARAIEPPANLIRPTLRDGY
jgi:hypothetical protein